MESQQITVRGLQLRWEEAGAGLPVVFIHGIPTSPALWRYVAPLVDGVRCLAFEMVGYGHSIPQGRDRDISVARQSAYLLGWMDALEIGRAIFVGHDLGGRRRTDRGRATATPMRRTAIDQRGLLRLLADTSVKAAQKAGAVLRRMPDAAVKPLFATLFHRGHDRPDRAREALQLYWPAYTRHGAAAAFVRQVRSLRMADTMAVADDLPRLDVPARIVWGAADRFQKISYRERLASDLNADLDRIENGKHWVPEDHPDAIASALQDVLAAAP